MILIRLKYTPAFFDISFKTYIHLTDIFMVTKVSMFD